MFGEPGCRKTFFMINLGFHVATGRTWCGREVDRCGVVYVAAEGGYGIQNRIAALKKHYDLDESRAHDIPFTVVPCGVDLLHPNADTSRLIELINRETEHFDVPVGLVIIDTLSRALAGGNENSSEDMGALIRNSDKIREQTGAHLCFIHHSGKDASRGGRGWSGVPAAIDTEIVVKRYDNVSVAKVKQQRDLEESEEEFSFSLQVVELGTNGRGKPVTSCVVVEAEGQHFTISTTLSPQQRLALDALDNCLVDLGRRTPGTRPFPTRPVTAVTRDQWREYCERAGVTSSDKPNTARQAFKRAVDGLKNKGIIAEWDEFVWRCDRSDKP